MRIHPVQLNLPLMAEELVDLLLVQWRTPVATEEGMAPSVLSESATQKALTLEKLCAWIQRQPENGRPLFILTPEISTSPAAIDRFKGLLSEIDRPTIVIAGLEHLSPTDYRELVSISSNPERELWTRDVDTFQKVNAAVILTRWADGTQRLYVQPKIRPADPEQRDLVYSSDQILVFHHNSHAPSEGLNFCVQICSDFCDAGHVSRLREEITTEFSNEDLRLDLTVLLQYNPVQNVPAFRNGSNAYFEVPRRKVRTKDGALVMINNASRYHHKSALWGDSQFRFPFGRWRQLGGEFTYWLDQVSGESWQAVLFREPGPSVYWVTYRPQYLSETRPGSGDAQSQPFTAASCWLIANLNDQEISFRPISAVTQWLEAEWVTGTAALVAWLEEQGIHTAIAALLKDRYSEIVKEWIAALTHDRAKGVVRILFACFKRGYPCVTNEYTDSEPNKWSENATKAATEMLRIHAMLHIGASRSARQLLPAPLVWRHALLGDTVSVTYLWGAAEMMSKTMVERYQNFLPPDIRASAQNVLVVLMNSKDRIEPKELARHLSVGQIDRASPPPGAGGHLAAGGEIVIGERWNPIFLYDQVLENSLSEIDAVAAEQRLSQVVEEVTVHATGA